MSVAAVVAAALVGCPPPAPQFLGPVADVAPEIVEPPADVPVDAPDIAPEPECGEDKDCPSTRCANGRCTDGVCGLAPIGCDDGNPCTVDGACDEDDGCYHKATPGVACDDEGPCGAGGVCVDAECQATAERLFKVVLDESDPAVAVTLTAAAVSEDGALMVGGDHRAGAAGADLHMREVSLLAEGAVPYVLQLPGEQQLTDVLLWDETLGLMIGVDTPGIVQQGIVACVNLSQDPAMDSGHGHQLLPGPLGRATVERALRHNDQLVLVGSAGVAAGFASGWFTTLDLVDADTCAWEQVHSEVVGPGGGLPSGVTDSLVDVAPTDDGFIALGRTASKAIGETDVWLTALDSTGNHVWSRTYGGLGAEKPTRLIPLADGYLLAGAQRLSLPANHDDMLVIRTDLQGALRWQQRYGGDADENLTDAIALDGGGFLLAGSTNGALKDGVWAGGVAGDKTDGLLVRIDASGRVLWQRAVSRPLFPDQLQGFAALHQVGDDFMALGHTTTAEGSRAFVVRTDGWGHATCDEAGVCAGVEFGSPDDGNPCTRAYCNPTVIPVNGVSVVPEAVCDDGSACTVGDQCVGESCQAGKPRLFDVPQIEGPMDRARGLVALPDGGLLVVGERGDTLASTDGAIVRTSATGEVHTSMSLGVTGEDAFRDVADVGNGTYAVAGFRNVPATDMRLVVLDSDANVLLDKTVDGGGIEVAHGVLVGADGGFVLFGERLGTDVDAFSARVTSAGVVQLGTPFGQAGITDLVIGGAHDDLQHVFYGARYETGPTGKQGWIVRADQNGAALDQGVTLGGNGQEVFRSGATLPEKAGFIAVGVSTTNSSDVPRPWVVVLDDTLAPVAAQPTAFETSVHNWRTLLGITPVSGGWLAYGNVYTGSAQDSLPYGTGKAWLVWLDPELQVTTECIIGESDDLDQRLSDATVLPDGSVAFAGWQAQPGNARWWIVHTDETCATTCEP